MLKPEDVLKGQLANVLGENAKLVCEVSNLTEQNQLLKKEKVELEEKVAKLTGKAVPPAEAEVKPPPKPN